MPGYGLPLQQGDGVLDRGGGAGDGGSLAEGIGSGSGEGAEPAAFDDANYSVGVGGKYGGTALAAGDGVAQEKDFGGGGRLFELCGLEGENLAGGAVFARRFEALRVLKVIGMEGDRDHRLARSDGINGQREEGYAEVAGERIGCDAEDGDVVGRVGRDDGGLEKAGRGVGPPDD